MRADIYWIADVPGGRLAILRRPRSGDPIGERRFIRSRADFMGASRNKKFATDEVLGFTAARVLGAQGWLLTSP
jgi:hypothetical protein